MKLTTNKDIYLTDPFMTVEKGQTVIGSSDNWATNMPMIPNPALL